MHLEIAAHERSTQLRTKQLTRAVELGDDLIGEIVTITPHDAAQWLRANKHNRPITRNHVHFLAAQMSAGQWQMNGQPIVVSDGENILDGQHRLLAIIESAVPIQTLVIYGISEEAFKTIDTGKVRSGGDALALYNPKGHHHKEVAAAVRWLQRLEVGFHGETPKLSNTDIIAYIEENPSVTNCVEYVASLPKDSRPLSLSCGTALYEIFQRRDRDLARAYITNLYTGENLLQAQPEWVLRSILSRDAMRLHKYPQEIRMKMAVKTWNLCRRGQDGTTNAIAVNPKDSPIYRIL